MAHRSRACPRSASIYAHVGQARHACAFAHPKNIQGPRHYCAANSVRVAAFLAPPPFVAGDDAAAYGDLRARISAAVKPADVLEEIWVHDIANLVWDVIRLRRLKASLMKACAHEGMSNILAGIGCRLAKRTQLAKPNDFMDRRAADHPSPVAAALSAPIEAAG